MHNIHDSFTYVSTRMYHSDVKDSLASAVFLLC